MTEEELQERITMYQDGLQESYNKRMALERRIRELEAENRALQERAQMRQELVEQYEKDIARLRQQTEWLIGYYRKSDGNGWPCPYLEGAFDQTKRCPCWTSYSEELPEDETLEAWKQLLLAPTVYGDEELDCGTSLAVCLRYAAEQAAKEKMKNNLLELLGIVLMITPSMLIGRYFLDVTSSLFWVSMFAAVPFHMVGIKLIRESK